MLKIDQSMEGNVSMLFCFTYTDPIAIFVRTIGLGNHVIALRSEKPTVVGEVFLQNFLDRCISILFEGEASHEMLVEEVADGSDGLVNDLRGPPLLGPVGIVGLWSRPNRDHDVFEDTLS